MIIDKDNIKLILIILVVSLGMGYAYINSDLNINGTAKIKNANWDVHWANVQVSNGSVTGTNVVTAPTISNQTTVNFSVVLPTPGDYYEFTVDAVNAGVIDAMIDSVDYKLNGSTTATLPDYLEYYVVYSDEVELEPNHLLAANSTENYKVRVTYRDDIELSQIPATDQTLNLAITVTYRQANDNAIEVYHPITGTRYAINFADFGSIGLGDEITPDLTLYSSAEEALAALRLATGDDNINFYLEHVIDEGIIEESYLNFIITSETAQANSGMTAGLYGLQGGIYSQESYEDNSATLLSAFGSSNCEISSEYTSCSVPGISAVASIYGYAYAYDDYWYCMAYNTSNCGEGWPVF